MSSLRLLIRTIHCSEGAKSGIGTELLSNRQLSLFMMARNGFNILENPWDYVGELSNLFIRNVCFCEENVWRMISINNEEIKVIKG